MTKPYMKIITRVILIVLLAAGLIVGYRWFIGRDERVYRGTFVRSLYGGAYIGYLY